MPEAEEIFDHLFYRPLAFVLVKAIYRLPITPNGVTLFSIITGFLAAWFFGIGTSSALIVGALWYVLTNILDCADGQLARLQKSGTLLGRVVDGVVDYIISLAIFIGIGVGLEGSGNGMWVLVVLTGVSSAIHAMFFDHYQSEFISTVRGERNFLQSELEQFTDEIERLKSEHRDGIKLFFLSLYVWYLHLQQRASTREHVYQFDPQTYRKQNILMIRLWSFLGPTTNRTLLIICALVGRIDAYLWIVLTVGNLWLAASYLLQRRIHRNLEAIGAMQTVAEKIHT